jgi:protein phosphatase
VRAANQRGGKDNITVVLFRLGEDGDSPASGDPAAAEETIHQGLTTDDVRAAVAERDRATAKRVRRRPRARARALVTAAVAVLVLGAVAAGAYAASLQVHFVGTDDDGLVTVYRGLPYELPLGVDLYSPEYRSGVPAASIPTARRDRVLDHQWRDESDAEDLVRQLETGSLDPGRQER